MQWTGFVVGLVAVAVTLWLGYSTEEDVPFAEAKEGTQYPRLPKMDRNAEPKRMWTEAELELRNGKNANRELLLTIVGEVYDVGGGEQFYSPGKGYSGFTGRDASRAFQSGEYNETTVRGMHEMTPEELKTVMDWRTFYRDHETYHFVGYMIGEYYDATGAPTQHLKDCERIFEEGLRLEKIKQEVSKMYLGCNSRHEQNKDTFELWCDDGYHVKGSVPMHLISTIKSNSAPTGRCVCTTPEMMEKAMAQNDDPAVEFTSRFFPYPECKKGSQHCLRPKGAKDPVDPDTEPKDDKPKDEKSKDGDK